MVSASRSRSAEMNVRALLRTSPMAPAMLALMSSAITTSSGVSWLATWVRRCGTPSSRRRKSFASRPFTNAPLSSRTSTLTWTTWTSTASAMPAPRVRTLVTARPPPGSCATARMTCSLTPGPASHGQVNGGRSTAQTRRPSAKKLTRSTAAPAGSIAAVRTTPPVT